MTYRPALGWSDLRRLRVGLYGMGREGTANLRKLRSMGVEPLIVSDKPKAGYGEDIVATAEGGLDALGRCDVVVKTPGISRYRPEVRYLDERGVPVLGGLGLWLQGADPARVVCVTGTKGKSTTASLVGHILSALGHNTLLAGNNGVPPYDPDLQVRDIDYWVIEVSSHQAPDLASSPPVAAITSLHPDHLTWHGGVEAYYRDKLSLFSRPGAMLTVANGDSDLIRERRSQLGPWVEWVSESDTPLATWMDVPGLPGRHNRRNALIARRCVLALGIEEAGNEDVLRSILEEFHGLPSRLAKIGVVDGVAFVDDSLSTNVLPTLAALDVYTEQRLALIVGGHDRGIDYGPLARRVEARTASTLVLTIPDNGARISAAFAETGLIETVNCPDLSTAVRHGYDWVRPSGVVLLSPAAPSFGVFRNYRDRAEGFARAMDACARWSTPSASPR